MKRLILNVSQIHDKLPTGFPSDLLLSVKHAVCEIAQNLSGNTSTVEVALGQSPDYPDGYVRSSSDHGKIMQVLQFCHVESARLGCFGHTARDYIVIHGFGHPATSSSRELVWSALMRGLSKITHHSGTLISKEDQVTLLFAGATTKEVYDVWKAYMEYADQTSSFCVFGTTSYPYKRGNSVTMLDDMETAVQSIDP